MESFTFRRSRNFYTGGFSLFFLMIIFPRKYPYLPKYSNFIKMNFRNSCLSSEVIHQLLTLLLSICFLAYLSDLVSNQLYILLGLPFCLHFHTCIKYYFPNNKRWCLPDEMKHVQVFKCFIQSTILHSFSKYLFN